MMFATSVPARGEYRSGGSCSAAGSAVILFWLGVCQWLVATVYSAKEVPVYEVSGIVGETVHLPCNISIAEGLHSEEDSVVLILWYREDLGTPIFSVDVRGKDFSRAEKWSDESVFNNRAYFEPDSKAASLVLDSVTEKDAAIYRCRVDFKYAQTRNSKVNLTVVVPPQKIVVLNEKHELKTTVVGPYTEKSDLILICQVFGGNPLPSITWFKNSKPLNGSVSRVAEQEGMKFVESTLTVRHLRRSDLHSQLTCEARNNPNRSLTAMVEVDMNFSPLNVKILPDEQPLTAKRKYDLICESTGSRPPAKLTWWKNDDRLERTKDSVSMDGNTTTSALTFIPSKEDKGKYLKCQAENPAVPSSHVLETRWKLHIHYIPETKIVLGTSLKSDSIEEGMDVYFDCLVNAHPPVYKVEWKKNNKLLQHNVQKGVIVSNQSLVLQKVTRSNGGNYTCIGYNAEGDGVSEPLYLNVMYAPFCKANQTRVYGIAKNEVANISCEVEANPLDLSFSWKFNNSGDSEDLASKVVNKSGRTFSIVTHTPTQEVDYGTLTCSASNKVGRQRTPCVFHIIAAGKPDSVSNCSVNNISVNSFFLRCVEGFNGGLVQTFVVVVKEEQEGGPPVAVSNISSPSPRFTVSNLQAGTAYRIYVYSSNAKGHSEPYQLEIITAGKRIPDADTSIEELPPERQSLNFQLTTTMRILVIASGVGLLMICILAAVLKTRCSRSSGDCKRQSKKQRRRASDANQTLCDGSDKSLMAPGIRSGCGGSISIGVDDSAASVAGLNGEFTVEVDDKNPDVIPQPIAPDMEKCNDYVGNKQRISTIENRYLLHENFLQYSNTPISYSGYCTLRTGIVPLQDLCRLNTKTTTIHSEPRYLATSSATLSRHPWPSYTTAVPIDQSHQCVYQTLPKTSMAHQPVQTQISVPPVILEKSLSNNSSPLANKQESAV